ncbi:MAG TPA: ABC transporter permease [Vicinamibacterales bacterium]|jgi:predicted permease
MAFSAFSLLHAMIQDFRYGLRMLVKSPAFTAIAVLSLALGIGANSAIFSLVNVALLKPIPVREPGRLAAVFTTDQRNPGNLPLSHLNYKDLRDQNQVFTEMAAVTFAQVNWSRGTASEQIQIQVVSGNYFSLLGAPLLHGRSFHPEEDHKATPVAVLSHGFWERSLGRDPDIVGKTVTLNRTPFTVIGVAAQGFTGTVLGGNPSMWVPLAMHDVVQPGFDWYETRRGLFLFAFGRLKPDVTVEQASANMRTIFAALEQAFPVDNKGRSAGSMSLLDARLNPQGQNGVPIVRLSAILMTIVGIVLLIACANIANLLLARASKRRKEIAVRLALGAGRLRLIRQLLTESILLSLVGGALGLLIAYWLCDALVATDLQLPLPVGEDLAIDRRVLLFTTLLAIATGVLFGLAPAIQASRPDVVPVLKNEIVPTAMGRGVKGFFALRQVLVIAQIALSLVSLVAATVFLQSLTRSERTNTGFETKGVLVMNFNLGREGYTKERGEVFHEELVARVRALPGVQHAAIAQSAPFGGGLLRSVFPEGHDTTTRGRILVQVNPVGLGYLQTIGIPLVKGRDFTRADAEKAPLVVIINETMADRFWPGEDPIGKRFKFFGDDEFTTIVGVARDSKYNAVAEEPTPFIYEPLLQNYTPQATLHVRASSDAAALSAPVRQVVQQIDPTLSIFNVRTLEEQVSDSLAPLRTNVIVMAAFGGLALLLASIGLYGVAAYSVTQRTREIGVRMALGAGRGSVLRLILGHGLVLVAIGVIVGTVAALGLMSLVPPALAPNVNVRDPLTLAATAALLSAIALLASSIPAVRATRIDPLIALRAE